MTWPNPPAGQVDPHGWSGMAQPPGLAPGTWIPSDNNFLAANAAVDSAQSTFTMIAGTIYLLKVPIRQAPVTISTITFLTSAAGSGASTGSFAGIYWQDGTRLGVTADIASAFTAAAGIQTVTLSTPVTVGGGFVWVGLVSNLATTQPALRAYAGTFAIPNAGPGGALAASQMRVATNGTGTALPASLTVSSNAASGAAMWVGLA